MSLINITGYFKGTIVSGEFNKSKSGLPQEIWILKASEIYDEENQEYLPVDDEHDEITAYLTLFNHDDSENFNGPQIKKLTGWDGGDFNVLADLDLAGIELSFSVEYGRGDFADRLGVGKVDVPDASPGRTVSKLAKEDVQALQARYAGVLAATKIPTMAVSAKGKKADTAKTLTTPKAKVTKPPAKPKTTAAVGKCTGQEAYDACYSLKQNDVTDERLDELWVKMVAQVNEDEAKISEKEWFQIKEKLLKVTAKV